MTAVLTVLVVLLRGEHLALLLPPFAGRTKRQRWRFWRVWRLWRFRSWRLPPLNLIPLFRHPDLNSRLSGVTPANQTKERPVHELLAGAFGDKSSMWIVLVSQGKAPEFIKWAKFMNFCWALSLVWFAGATPETLQLHPRDNFSGLQTFWKTKSMVKLYGWLAFYEGFLIVFVRGILSVDLVDKSTV